MSHPSPLNPALERAHALVAVGDLAGAAELLQRAVELGRVNLRQDDPAVLGAQRELASVLQQSGDTPGARRALEEAYAAGQRALGDADPLMLQVSYDLGVVAEQLGNRHEARRAFGRVATHGPAVLGVGHWAVMRAQSYLGQDPTALFSPIPVQRAEPGSGGPRVTPPQAPQVTQIPPAPQIPQPRVEQPPVEQPPVEQPRIVQASVEQQPVKQPRVEQPREQSAAMQKPGEQKPGEQGAASPWAPEGDATGSGEFRGESAWGAGTPRGDAPVAPVHQAGPVVLGGAGTAEEGTGSGIFHRGPVEPIVVRRAGEQQQERKAPPALMFPGFPGMSAGQEEEAPAAAEQPWKPMTLLDGMASAEEEQEEQEKPRPEGVGAVIVSMPGSASISRVRPEPSVVPEPEPAEAPVPEPAEEPAPERVREPAPVVAYEPDPVPEPEPAKEPEPEPAKEPEPEPDVVAVESEPHEVPSDVSILDAETGRGALDGATSVIPALRDVPLREESRAEPKRENAWADFEGWGPAPGQPATPAPAPPDWGQQAAQAPGWGQQAAQAPGWGQQAGQGQAPAQGWTEHAPGVSGRLDAVAPGVTQRPEEQQPVDPWADAQGQAGYPDGQAYQGGYPPNYPAGGYGGQVQSAGYGGGHWPSVPAHPQGASSVIGGMSGSYDKKSDESGSRRGGAALFAVIAASLAAIVAVAALVFTLANRTEQQQPAAGGGDGGDVGTQTSVAPTGPVLAGDPPTGVKLADQGSSIEVSWTDPAAGSVSFMITMAHPGEQLKPVSTVGPGQTSRKVDGLSSALDYCFAVVAVYSTNTFASSPQVCTDRGKK
ncbi:tetratricopeptide repeat protein [Actinoplanes sp. NPDC051851]|uniref:fibronectin type III domain-containing protein n=1 Tax=Actinoplanes sp. NPDC051851 TaxID=3154753 RepID=UPI003444CE07